MRKHLGITVLFGAVILAAPSDGQARESMLDDFESARAPEPWTFSNGPEFPGAKGSLTRGAGHSRSGATSRTISPAAARTSPHR